MGPLLLIPSKSFTLVKRLIEKGTLVAETGFSTGSAGLASLATMAGSPMLNMGNFTELKFTNLSQWAFAGELGCGSCFKGGENYED